MVENHEAGLLFVEGRLVERLAPGRHAFWMAGRKIEVKRLDLRPQAPFRESPNHRLTKVISHRSKLAPTAWRIWCVV